MNYFTFVDMFLKGGDLCLNGWQSNSVRSLVEKSK